MKRALLLASLSLTVLGQMFAQYPIVTVRQIQEVPLDSLVIADSLQNTIPSRWTLQRSPLYEDTVTVVALCLVPGKVLTFTQAGYTMLLCDTAQNSDPWKCVFVRTTSDTTSHIADGFLNVARGNIIAMTGRVNEFPTVNMNSVTQFEPIPGIPITILGSGTIPSPISMTVGQFYQGIFPGGVVQYSTGEPYENMFVELTDLTVDARVNPPRGTFSMIDASGDQMTDYDASRFFTLGHGGSFPFPGDTIWAQEYPVVGTQIDTIRGFITTVAGSESPRGYRIAPIYRGDVVAGVVLPSITQHIRNPIVVSPSTGADISVHVDQQLGGFPIASVELFYSIDNGPFSSTAMTFQFADSTYNATIPQQSANTFVHYFIKATDQPGNSAILASSAFGGASSDTAQGFYFYTVLDRPLTIQDIQYTPYLNGRSAYIGANVSVNGVVTADTAHIGIAPLNIAGTNAWFMQDGNQPWNGIWFVPTIAESLASLRNGDSLTVSGIVDEQFEVTRLEDVALPVTIHSTGNPEPGPVSVTTGTFGPNVGNGTPTAEQREGMLVRFNNVTVTSIDPVFSDPTEFEIDDGTGPILVRRDGTHTYSNVPADTILGKTILMVGDRISHVDGIIHYSFNRYKIVPRANDDFGTVTSVPITREPTVPARYVLQQNYPNPFNPSTTISYGLPRGTEVTLKIYNVLGQEVRTLVNQFQEPGTYNVRLDGASFASGVYFYRLAAGEFHEVKKMLLLK